MVTMTKSALRAVSLLLIPPLPNHVIGRLPICHSNFKICQRKPMVLTFRWNLGRIFEHYFFLLKEIWITSLKWVGEMTVISDYMLSSSFFCQPFYAFPREIGAYTSTFFIGCICCFADPSCFVCWSWLCLFFFLHFITKWQQKLS